jgi:hypothetical protein
MPLHDLRLRPRLALPYGRIALRLLRRRVLSFRIFNLTNILGCPAGVNTRYSSRLPFSQRRVSGALAKFLERRLLGVCCGISTFDEIRF